MNQVGKARKKKEAARYLARLSKKNPKYKSKRKNKEQASYSSINSFLNQFDLKQGSARGHTGKRKAAGGRVKRGHQKLGKYLESIGFKKPNGEIYPHKRSRFFCLDETGGKKVKDRSKRLGGFGEDLVMDELSESAHVSLLPTHDLDGNAFPPLAIVAGIIYLPRAVFELIDEIWEDSYATSTENGYVNS